MYTYRKISSNEHYHNTYRIEMMYIKSQLHRKRVMFRLARV